jgi:hypothetical protein
VDPLTEKPLPDHALEEVFICSLRPVASHALYQGARLQAEKCFLARTCRARKQTKFYFTAVAVKLYEVFF